MTICTRFPPSPTGYLHIGGARTALFNWLYARKHQGKLILRIEDTDAERSTAESVEAIFDGLKWLNLDYDEGPFYQTQRMSRYAQVIQELIEMDKAYYCYCSKEELDEMREQQRTQGVKPRYDGRCRDRTDIRAGVDPVVRFKNPLDGEVVIDDLVKGEIIIGNKELDDLIIARSDGSPTYNLTVVVDDIDMGITHVIRGDDHINNTPRQINIIQAMGSPLPIYAHVPMILGSDGKRMSKRHGTVSVMEYREQGILPHAMLNYLARLGWSHGDDELFSVDQLVDLFSVEAIHGNPAIFDPNKLLWVNYEHMKTASLPDLKEHSKYYFEKHGVNIDIHENWEAVLAANQQRSKTLVELAERSLFFFKEPTDYDSKAANKHFKDPAKDILKKLCEQLASLANWNTTAIHDIVHLTAESFEVGLGKVAQPIRVAVSGTAVSPPIDETLYILGQEATLQRLKKAIGFIGASK